MKSSVEHYKNCLYICHHRQARERLHPSSKVKTTKIVPSSALGDKLFHYLPVFGPVCTILPVSTSEFWRSLLLASGSIAQLPRHLVSRILGIMTVRAGLRL